MISPFCQPCRIGYAPIGNANIDVEERVQRFRSYYAKENDRPLLGFFVGSEYPLFRYRAASNLPTSRALTADDFPVEAYLDDCDRLFAEHEACGGDFIWSASAFWGIPWLEAALGCSLYADHRSGCIHTSPPEGFSTGGQLPRFDPQSPWIAKAKEFLLAMAESSRGRYPIGTTRMRGIADLLAALYGGEGFVYAMIEEPERVHEICWQLTDFWRDFARFQLAHIPLYHGGIGSFYYNMWAPAGTVWHQEDAAALLSPHLYSEFIKPCDATIAESFDGCIIHQHSTGYVPTESYMAMNMIALELHIDEGGPSAQDLYDWHMSILAEKPLLIWGRMTDADLDWIFGELPHRGLAVCVAVDDPSEAQAIWRKYICR